MMRLDELETKLAQLATELVAARAKVKPLAQAVSRIEQQVRETERQIEDARKQPRVSDHAVIRYLERKYGFSFERVRAEILTPDRVSAINAGATGISHEGVRFLVRDKTITTVVECH